MPTVDKVNNMECTVSDCSCDCFCPGKTRTRICDSCEHNWVVHAMDKVSYRTPGHHHQSGGGRSVVEVVQPSVVFDIASLMLYGSQATPIRIKILLDRLFSVVQHDDIVRVLHSFGWTYEDYCRGYILQESSSGRVLDRWSIVSPEEELIILQQFLRFGETQAIARELIDRCDSEPSVSQDEAHRLSGSGSPQSKIKKFIEGDDDLGAQGLVRGYDAAVHRLLSRNFLYPHLASAGFARLLALRGLQAREMIATGNSLLCNKQRGLLSKNDNQSAAAINADLSSTRSTLQCLQPLDYRNDSSYVSSPMTSCLISTASSVEGRGTFAGPAVSGQGSGIAPPRPTKVKVKVKAEVPEERNSTTGRIVADDTEEQTMTSDGAINYSIKDRRTPAAANGLARPCNASSSFAASQATVSADINTSSSMLAHQKPKQLPMKRKPWQPILGYGGTLISAAGKKRVLCTACHKTFCDKGALKIHYSAVHLREMHRCTVDGCAMTFSSRRSRNRHSANPNPKLHLPHIGRRKLPVRLTASNQTDEEEEEAAFEAPSLSGSSAAPDDCASGDLLGTKGFARSSNPDVLDASSSSSASSEISAVQQVAPYPPRAVPRFFLGTGLPAASSSPVQDLGPGVDARSGHRSPGEEEAKGKEKADSNQSRSGSKRKSAMPTRCSLQTNAADSDEDEDDSPGDSKRPRRTWNHLPATSQGFLYSAAAKKEQRDTAPTERDYVTATKVDDSRSSSSSSSSSHSSSSNEAMRSEVVYSDRNQRFDNFRRQSNAQGNHVTDDERTNGGPKATSVARLVNRFSSHLNDASPSLSLDSKKNCASEILSAPFLCEENSTETDENGSGKRRRTFREACDYIGGSSSDATARGSNGVFRKDLVDEEPSGPTAPLVVSRPSIHACVVVGCNATFHSRRSRDRHSANGSLHRRLLSTAPPPPPHTPPSWHEEGPRTRPDGMAETMPASEGHKYAYEVSIREAICDVLNLSKNAPTTDSPLQSESGSHLNESGRDLEEFSTGFPDHSTSNGSPVFGHPIRTTPVEMQTASLSETYNGDDFPASESLDAGGCVTVVVCHLCQRPFKDNLALKEHREDVHPTQVHRCTIFGCDKVFSTRKSRNRHSQNDNLHKHLPTAS